MRLSESGLRKVIRRIVSEQAELPAGIGGGSDPYKEFYMAMYHDKGDERSAAQRIRMLVGSTSPEAFQEIMDGLMAAGLNDEDDAEHFAYGILNRTY